MLERGWAALRVVDDLTSTPPSPAWWHEGILSAFMLWQLATLGGHRRYIFFAWK